MPTAKTSLQPIIPPVECNGQNGKFQKDGNSEAAENASGTKTLFHYTNQKGMNGIVESKKWNPSLKANNPKDVRYGNGQYLSDIRPETTKPTSLAAKFIYYANRYKYTHYVEIDVTDLNVIQERVSL